jgi:hypothetical protein
MLALAVVLASEIGLGFSPDIPNGLRIGALAWPNAPKSSNLLDKGCKIKTEIQRRAALAWPLKSRSNPPEKSRNPCIFGTLDTSAPGINTLRDTQGGVL